ncbi:alpha/beta fold hydrolase [Urechidicola croceus]|uniref:Alpha/beta hydrolase n=1 Tax=Urechidicola croceus TaxID=1850246 RepID=A0A1D8PAP8_9FLAO|nr:alpha/beta hydrolase [Urechidicola croceus]AOW21611.1 alpha/beta hydrolase [Urechidicola croceus]
MKYTFKKEGDFNYIEEGEGQPIIILHGLMGDLNNFEGIIDHFSKIGYKVLAPELPLYTLPLIKTNVRNLSKFIKDFMNHKQVDNVVFIGNSLGGHISLYFTKLNIKNIKALVLTGSSGLYEKSMGDSYPKRGDYDYIKNKVEEVFYDPKTATKELVDSVFDVVSDRTKVIKTLSIAKSAIRHNMGDDLPNMNVPTCIIWGKQDNVTPPEVADEFHKLLPDSDLYWIDKCGHAPMMEHPKEFNSILEKWFIERNI